MDKSWGQKRAPVIILTSNPPFIASGFNSLSTINFFEIQSNSKVQIGPSRPLELDCKCKVLCSRVKILQLN